MQLRRNLDEQKVENVIANLLRAGVLVAALVVVGGAVFYLGTHSWLRVDYRTFHGEPDELKRLPDVSPPGTRRLDVTCDHVTRALQAMRDMPGVRSATVFGQSMHLLVGEEIKRAQIEEKLRSIGIGNVDVHVIGPSLEDVFVTLTAKHANADNRKAA